MAESASQVVKKETGFSKSVSNQVPGNQTSINTDDIVLSAKKEVADRGDTRKRLVKYGIISAALGLIIIVAVIALDYANKTASEVVNNTFLELHKPQELEKEQLQIEAKAEAEAEAEAEVLKKERDVVLAKIKEEKDAKEEAEKLAAEKLAAEKAALAKRKAAEWDKERLFQQARLERKKRIKQQEEARQQQEEARRLELEWLEQERQALREAQASQ